MRSLAIKYAMILAGGKRRSPGAASRVERAKAAVPFGGCYRLIDFPRSTCVNSGIYDINVLTQHQTFSFSN